MKSKKVISAFVFLSLIGFSLMVQAASFEYKAEEDKLYIYEITQFDEDVVEDLYVPDYTLEDLLGKDAEVGAMYCVMITDVDETESGGNDAFAVSGWYWWYNNPSVGWTDDESDFEDPDDDDIWEFDDWIVMEDSDDMGEIPSIVSFSSFIYTVRYTFIPSPAEDWLDELEFGFDFVEVNGLAIELEYDKDDYPSLNDDYEIHFTWKNNGVFESIKTYGDGDPMYEVSLKSSLIDDLLSVPGYELSILLGFLGVITAGSIFSVKKMNNEKE
ncbi:MAG: exported protein of unknown function [Promethearchaeota archaeon]|nr:MAG: exported protein of unknown function [Candidatus Lokiarchaeota archaeon]